MKEVLLQSFHLLLDELGIDEKRQFAAIIFVGLVALVVWSVRDRHQHGLLITFLFCLLGLSTLVFLFTDSEAARHWSALIASLSIAAILGWEFVRRRRAAAAAAGAGAEDREEGSTSSARA